MAIKKSLLKISNAIVQKGINLNHKYGLKKYILEEEYFARIAAMLQADKDWKDNDFIYINFEGKLDEKLLNRVAEDLIFLMQKNRYIVILTWQEE